MLAVIADSPSLARIQLEDAVARRPRRSERRWDENQTSEQGEQKPHRRSKSFLPNYALNEREVRSL